MSPSAELTSAQYLSRLAAMDAASEAASIVALRAHFLGIETHAGEEQAIRDRDALAAQVKSLREQFWSAEPDDVIRAADELALDDFPDLAAAAARLKAVAESRRELARVAESLDAEFVKQLRAVLVADPRRARVLRDKFLGKLGSPKRYKRVRASVKRLKSKCRGVFDLEKDWLTQILTLKKDRKLMTVVKKTWWTWWIIAYILLRLLGAL